MGSRRAWSPWCVCSPPVAVRPPQARRCRPRLVAGKLGHLAGPTLATASASVSASASASARATHSPAAGGRRLHDIPGGQRLERPCYRAAGAPEQRYVAGRDGSPSRHLHPDYGPAGSKGEPLTASRCIRGRRPAVVLRDVPSTTRTRATPATTCSPGASTPIESGSDAHVIMVNGRAAPVRDSDATQYRPNGQSTAGLRRDLEPPVESLRPRAGLPPTRPGLPCSPGS